VYLPGGGWRGFDPTEGHAVNENYIALARSAQADLINPVTGTYKSKTSVSSELEAHVEILEA
jgi:transglutaminase-like putative cysteine protease